MIQHATNVWCDLTSLGSQCCRVFVQLPTHYSSFSHLYDTDNIAILAAHICSVFLRLRSCLGQQQVQKSIIAQVLQCQTPCRDYIFSDSSQPYKCVLCNSSQESQKERFQCLGNRILLRGLAREDDGDLKHITYISSQLLQNHRIQKSNDRCYGTAQSEPLQQGKMLSFRS